MSLDELYREVILDHYKSPRNRGELPEPRIRIEAANPLCGDELTLDLAVRDGRVAEARFNGRGCSISQASASMMTEAIKGKSFGEAEHLVREFTRMMHGEEPEAPDELGDGSALQGVAKYPVRIKCALLAWNALKQGIDEAREKGNSDRA